MYKENRLIYQDSSGVEKTKTPKSTPKKTTPETSWWADVKIGAKEIYSDLKQGVNEVFHTVSMKVDKTNPPPPVEGEEELTGTREILIYRKQYYYSEYTVYKKRFDSLTTRLSDLEGKKKALDTERSNLMQRHFSVHDEITEAKESLDLWDESDLVDDDIQNEIAPLETEKDTNSNRVKEIDDYTVMINDLFPDYQFSLSLDKAIEIVKSEIPAAEGPMNTNYGYYEQAVECIADLDAAKKKEDEAEKAKIEAEKLKAATKGKKNKE